MSASHCMVYRWIFAKNSRGSLIFNMSSCTSSPLVEPDVSPAMTISTIVVDRAYDLARGIFGKSIRMFICREWNRVFLCIHFRIGAVRCPNRQAAATAKRALTDLCHAVRDNDGGSPAGIL